MQGRPLAERIRAQVADDVRELGEIGLATVQVGEDEASTIYLRLKHQAASEVEIASVDHKLPHAISEEELLGIVAGLNADDELDGILIQLPLPDHIDEARVISAITPAKDVDGIHPMNAGGRNSSFCGTLTTHNWSALNLNRPAGLSRILKAGL